MRKQAFRGFKEKKREEVERLQGKYLIFKIYTSIPERRRQ